MKGNRSAGGQNCSSLRNRVSDFLTPRNRYVMTALAFALVLFIGAIDYITGPEMSIAVFYLLPIVLAASFINKKTAIGLAVLSALVWLVVDLRSASNSSHQLHFGW